MGAYLMLGWQRIPERVRAGIRFTLATILIGPTAFTMTGWAASDFQAPFDMLFWSHVETTTHFVWYGLVFFPSIAWARTRPPLPLAVRAIGYFGLSVLATSIAVAVNGAVGIDDGNLRHTFLKTIVFGLVLSPVLLLVESIWDRLGEARREMERRALEQEQQRRAAAEARWTSLESRLHPHFVFNTLASIRELLHRDARRAELMIQRFAELLRFSLDAPQHPLIPLEEELRMVTGYLEIEQMRLGSRLDWSIVSSPDVEMLRVPSLSVLTLTENAIKHSIAARRSGGKVTVTARRDGERLSLEVADDGPGFAGESLPPGHGLELLRERLRLVYGSAAAMRIRPREPGVAVEIVLPTHVQEPLDAEAPLLRR